MLRPACEESQRLIQWVEEGEVACHPSRLKVCLQHTTNKHLLHAAGVYDAVKKQYLHTLMFGISTNMDGTSLLEVRDCILPLLHAPDACSHAEVFTQSAAIHLHILL